MFEKKYKSEFFQITRRGTNGTSIIITPNNSKTEGRIIMILQNSSHISLLGYLFLTFNKINQRKPFFTLTL